MVFGRAERNGGRTMGGALLKLRNYVRGVSEFQTAEKGALESTDGRRRGDREKGKKKSARRITEALENWQPGILRWAL